MFNGSLEETIRHYHMFITPEKNVGVPNPENYTAKECDEIVDYIKANKPKIVATKERMDADIRKKNYYRKRNTAAKIEREELGWNS